jgi:hypothetical protein
MIAIILEGVLFVALVATAAALVFVLLLRVTPLGLWLRQGHNRRQIDEVASLACPLHGVQREETLVRLPDGSRLCSRCYKEAVHGESAG